MNSVLAPDLSLSVLGYPQLSLASEPLKFPTKKALALFIYLSIEEVRQQREHLANLFWPESQSKTLTSRGDLRSCILQINKTLLQAGLTELASDRDSLGLSFQPKLDIDGIKKIGQLYESFKLSRQPAQVANFLTKLKDLPTETFLNSFFLPDAPDFELWLEHWRAVFLNQQDKLLAFAADYLEQQNRFEDALLFAQRRLKLENLNETAQQQVIKLHFILGDEQQALKTYQTYEALVAKDLAQKPAFSLESLKTRLLSVTKVPGSSLLVGRDHELELMEDAWSKHKVIFISGEAGSGKTSLMQHFLLGKGPYIVMNAKPIDKHIPYACQTRSLRLILETCPIVLEPWVREELSKLMPELEGHAQVGLSNKIRLYEAIFEVYKQAVNVYTSLVVDDFQNEDAASFEAGAYMSDKNPQLTHILTCFRSNEVEQSFLEQVKQMVDYGLAVHIQLEPLKADDIEQILKQTKRDDLLPYTEKLLKLTGGNAVFLEELLLHLKAQPELPNEDWSKPPKLFKLVSQRLEFVSREASELVRLLAVAEEVFSLEMAQFILDLPTQHLFRALTELEKASLIEDVHFKSELVKETIYDMLALSRKHFLHHKVASFLEQKGHNPHFIAEHYWQAGKQEQADYYWQLSAEDYAHRGLSEAAKAMLERKRILT